MAALNARNAHIRLTIPEAFAVHKAVIAWNATTSDDRLPDASLGADPVLLVVMRWAMASWERASFLNRYLGGTLHAAPHHGLPARSSLQRALRADRPERARWHRGSRGRGTGGPALLAHGDDGSDLQVQPSYTPLVFARYAREQRRFTSVARAEATAREVAERLDRLLGSARQRRAPCSWAASDPRALSRDGPFGFPSIAWF